MSDSLDTATFTIESSDGSTDEVELPTELIDILSEEETTAEAVTDVVLIGFAQRAHAIVHHAQADFDADVEALEEAVLDTFEERFGMTFAEMTGHDH
ncbi:MULTISPECIES: hypothetical protein [unclassified Haladaptatus]|uniref:DUF7545 family protein n=1 Tax=unclassified Haladaptatus TaxID=2622732 RepID=UPI0023E75D1E|nr:MULTISPECIES: hypothetical protein [unclassified Haladaptatus]